MEIAIQMFIDKETADDDFITSIAETTKQLLQNVRKEGYEPTLSTFLLDCKPDYYKGQIAIKAKIGTEVLDVNKFMTGGAFIDMIKEMDNESINEKVSAIQIAKDAIEASDGDFTIVPVAVLKDLAEVIEEIKNALENTFKMHFE